MRKDNVLPYLPGWHNGGTGGFLYLDRHAMHELMSDPFPRRELFDAAKSTWKVHCSAMWLEA